VKRGTWCGVVWESSCGRVDRMLSVSRLAGAGPGSQAYPGRCREGTTRRRSSSLRSPRREQVQVERPQSCGMRGPRAAGSARAITRRYAPRRRRRRDCLRLPRRPPLDVAQGCMWTGTGAPSTVCCLQRAADNLASLQRCAASTRAASSRICGSLHDAALDVEDGQFHMARKRPIRSSQ
jgi:hypothetical protein